MRPGGRGSPAALFVLAAAAIFLAVPEADGQVTEEEVAEFLAYLEANPPDFWDPDAPVIDPPVLNLTIPEYKFANVTSEWPWTMNDYEAPVIDRQKGTHALQFADNDTLSMSWDSAPAPRVVHPTNGSWVDYYEIRNGTHYSYNSSVTGAWELDTRDCTMVMNGVNEISHTLQSAPPGSDEWEVHGLNGAECEYGFDDTRTSVVMTKTGPGGRYSVLWDFSDEGAEWTYAIEASNQSAPAKYGFSFRCDGPGCALHINGTESAGTVQRADLITSRIELDNLSLDLKDDTHNATWVARTVAPPPAGGGPSGASGAEGARGARGGAMPAAHPITDIHFIASDTVVQPGGSYVVDPVLNFNAAMKSLSYINAGSVHLLNNAYLLIYQTRGAEQFYIPYYTVEYPDTDDITLSEIVGLKLARFSTITANFANLGLTCELYATGDATLLNATYSDRDNRANAIHALRRSATFDGGLGTDAAPAYVMDIACDTAVSFDSRSDDMPAQYRQALQQSLQRPGIHATIGEYFISWRGFNSTSTSSTPEFGFTSDQWDALPYDTQRYFNTEVFRMVMNYTVDLIPPTNFTAGPLPRWSVYDRFPEPNTINMVWDPPAHANGLLPTGYKIQYVNRTTGVAHTVSTIAQGTVTQWFYPYNATHRSPHAELADWGDAASLFVGDTAYLTSDQYLQMRLVPFYSVSGSDVDGPPLDHHIYIYKIDPAYPWPADPAPPVATSLPVSASNPLPKQATISVNLTLADADPRHLPPYTGNAVEGFPYTYPESYWLMAEIDGERRALNRAAPTLGGPSDIPYYYLSWTRGDALPWFDGRPPESPGTWPVNAAQQPDPGTTFRLFAIPQPVNTSDVPDGSGDYYQYYSYEFNFTFPELPVRHAGLDNLDGPFGPKQSSWRAAWELEDLDYVNATSFDITVLQPGLTAFTIEDIPGTARSYDYDASARSLAGTVPDPQWYRFGGPAPNSTMRIVVSANFGPDEPSILVPSAEYTVCGLPPTVPLPAPTLDLVNDNDFQVSWVPPTLDDACSVLYRYSVNVACSSCPVQAFLSERLAPNNETTSVLINNGPREGQTWSATVSYDTQYGSAPSSPASSIRLHIDEVAAPTVTEWPVATPGTMEISWPAFDPHNSRGAIEYDVYRDEQFRRSQGSHGPRNMCVDVSGTSCIDRGQNIQYGTWGPGYVYCYTVRVTVNPGAGATHAHSYQKTSPPACAELHYLPTAITDLEFDRGTIAGTGTLEWTAPRANTLRPLGYMINWSTPAGDDPRDILVELAPVQHHAYSLRGLPESTSMSFRVAMVTPHTQHDRQTLGNVVKITLPSANFTAGHIDVNTDRNPAAPGVGDGSIRPVVIEPRPVSGPDRPVGVGWPGRAMSMQCDVTDFGSGSVKTVAVQGSALTTGRNYDTITVKGGASRNLGIHCYDAPTGLEGRGYAAAEGDPSFPFLDWIDHFELGTYGTTDDFGVFDLVTLATIFISMIGFNRSSPAVGLVIAVMIIGAASAFGVIRIETTLFGALALIVMLGIVTTRRR